MTQEIMEILRKDLVDCFKAQRMAQILDVADRDILEAAFADRLDSIFAEYNRAVQTIERISHEAPSDPETLASYGPLVVELVGYARKFLEDR